MVFQGTVWGPILWNCFFEDARLAIRTSGFQEVVFADDLNSCKTYEARTSDAYIMNDLESCQLELHRWGEGNQVVFDASKEGLFIIDARRPVGQTFRILGITFDTKLVMDQALHEITAQGHSRTVSVLRARPHYPVRKVVQLCLSHFHFWSPAFQHIIMLQCSSCLCLMAFRSVF